MFNLRIFYPPLTFTHYTSRPKVTLVTDTKSNAETLQLEMDGTATILNTTNFKKGVSGGLGPTTDTLPADTKSGNPSH